MIWKEPCVGACEGGWITSASEFTIKIPPKPNVSILFCPGSEATVITYYSKRFPNPLWRLMAYLLLGWKYKRIN